MYGWINASLESLILNNHGVDVWAQITEEAGCPVQSGDFIRNVNYPDDLTKRLFETACKVLQISQEELVERSGVNFIRFVQQNGYESTIRCQGTTFAEWLRNLNEPHRLLKSRFPDSKFPEFWCVNDEDDQTGQTLILHYYSYRGKLFAPMVLGCVKEAAKVYFDLDAHLELVFQELNENVLHAAWRVITVCRSPSSKSPKKRTKFGHDEKTKSTTTSSVVELDEVVVAAEDFAIEFNDIMEETKVLGKCPFSHLASKGGASNNLHNFQQVDTPPPLLPLRKPMVINEDLVLSSEDPVMSEGPIVSRESESSDTLDGILDGNMDPIAATSHSHNNAPNVYNTQKPSNTNYSNMPTSYNIGLSPNRLKDAFPFHLVVNQKLQIIQIGDKLAKLILECNSYASILQAPVSNFFGIAIPPNYPWDWQQLIKLEDTTIELTLLTSFRKLSFRGSFVIMSPEKDGHYVTELSALFLININVHDINEMSDMNLKLSDFPRHNFQRDLLIIGEHLKSEASSAVELGVLSKKLNQESKLSLNALKTKRIFVRYVSHEIRTPLNITLLGLKFLEDELVKSNSKLLGDVSDVLEDVKSSCGVAVDILNDLLLYEKLDDGIFTLSMSEVSFRDFFFDAVNVFKVQALSFDIEFEVDSSGMENVIVNIDRMKFSQVLRNLVSNALKFTPKKGKVTVTSSVVNQLVRDDSVMFADVMSESSNQSTQVSDCNSQQTGSTSSSSSSKSELGRRSYSDMMDPKFSPASSHHRPGKSFIRIAIADTGSGINKDDQKHLFHEFTQFKADKLQNGQGSGLGLWIADNIMRLHGGRIGIWSEGEGKGSTFLVDLPIQRHETLSNVITASPINVETLSLDAAEQEEDVLAHKRLLIVDDAPTNRKIVHKMLRGKFAHIDEAENGQEAVDKYINAMKHHKPYDVIMMDFLMPVMNGLEATKLIRSYEYHSTVIVGVTGNGLQSDIDLFMESGADKVMIKPLNIQQFVSYLLTRFQP